MIHQYINGSSSSESKLNNLLKNIQVIDSSIIKINSLNIHYTQFTSDPNEKEIHLLQDLLSYGDQNQKIPSTSNKLIIIPRLGTISPWSSKATEIAKKCHLDINRIERGRVIYLFTQDNATLSQSELNNISSLLFDKMTESLILTETDGYKLFDEKPPKQLQEIDILNNGQIAIAEYNYKMGLALSDDEITYLYNYFLSVNKNPTDAELMMFAQANSEHCRHKIFNASWIIDGTEKSHSLFSMIRNTHKINPNKTITAYSDNSSVVEGFDANRFYPSTNNVYSAHKEKTHYLMKVETHNHPTAISPFPGAATGSGGEIRDEGATGRGSKPKAGLTGFSVSNLNIPSFKQDWEFDSSRPDHIASPLEIMIDAPIGGAAYNNEFGRPNIAGYFRVFEQKINQVHYGYHKPIMLAGGVGNINVNHTEKKPLNEDVLLIQLGGPGMLIGLGGGAASSMDSGSNEKDLDFASVQRGNPEIQRRAQEVIDRCWQLNEGNPILSIHDVGAGGLSNAFPELINDGGVGAIFDIRNVHSEEKGMAPHELWCNESQERYVLAISKDSIDLFTKICARERCPFSIVGHATTKKDLIVKDSLLNKNLVEMNLDVLLGRPPKTLKNIKTLPKEKFSEEFNFDITKTIDLVMSHPSVASKKFLIQIGDRSVTGLIAQDQMVGPWQVPVSDVAVTKQSFEDLFGESFAIGERSPIAVIDSKKSARMAIGESITNIQSSYIGEISNIKLSANWMAACGTDIEDKKLFDAVETVGMELCPALGISIPVGKDSMSMKSSWGDNEVKSPISLIVTAFSECPDVTKTASPELLPDEDFILLYVDLGNENYRMGGSIAEQVNQIITNDAPDLDDPELFKNTSMVLQSLLKNRMIKAYHDRSDGGLVALLLEMAFAGRCGLDIDLSAIDNELSKILFSEELGFVIQIHNEDAENIISAFKQKKVQNIYKIGTANKSNQINIKHHDMNLSDDRSRLENLWSLNSFHIQSLRDNENLAKEELNLIFDNNDPGINEKLSYKLEFPNIVVNNKPKIAILREQGVNGHYEMAAAFHYAGFESIDVHMQDLISGDRRLSEFKAFVACGGFSYGDVLGAGEGWAKVILNNHLLKDQFEDFFTRKDTIALGVCNGCQMLSNIKTLIPGASSWPKLVRNYSDQFESRVVTVRVPRTNSIFFKDMENSFIPVITAHGEGRAEFKDQDDLNKLIKMEQITLQYVDNKHVVTEVFPFNPNGSLQGVTGFSNDDGRFNIMMPHPERVFRFDQQTWSRNKKDGYGAWFKFFTNAAYFIKNN